MPRQPFNMEAVLEQMFERIPAGSVRVQLGSVIRVIALRDIPESLEGRVERVPLETPTLGPLPLYEIHLRRKDSMRSWVRTVAREFGVAILLWERYPEVERLRTSSQPEDRRKVKKLLRAFRRRWLNEKTRRELAQTLQQLVERKAGELQEIRFS